MSPLQHNSIGNYNSQTNHCDTTSLSNATAPSTVSSIGVDIGDTFQKFASSTVPSTSADLMRPVTSQGMLLPLVQLPADAKESNCENPKQQLQECMHTIEEALKDPTLADAGKVLLQAIHASSGYMNGLLESRRSSQTPEPTTSDSSCALDARFFLNAPIKPREETILFPHLPTWKSASADLAPSSQQDTIPLVPNQGKDPASQAIPANDDITPVLSSTTPPAVESNVSRKSTSKPTTHKASCGRVEKIGKPHKRVATQSCTTQNASPHEQVMELLRNRGYSTERMTIDRGGYISKPTPLQLASFGKLMVQAVNNSDTETVSKLLDCGLSPNPCNQFGDSILSLICKRADYNVFAVFLEHGCDLRVCDSFGRTALHHLAWAGKFSAPLAKAILTCDPHQILMEDKLGKCPMEYVRGSKSEQWIAFWNEHADVIWPPLSGENSTQGSTPRSGPVVGSFYAVSPTLASKIASGEVCPDDALRVRRGRSSPPMISLDFS